MSDDDPDAEAPGATTYWYEFDDVDDVGELFDASSVETYAESLLTLYHRGVESEDVALEIDDANAILDLGSTLDDWLTDDERREQHALENTLLRADRGDREFADLTDTESRLLELRMDALHRYREYQAALADASGAAETGGDPR